MNKNIKLISTISSLMLLFSATSLFNNGNISCFDLDTNLEEAAVGNYSTDASTYYSDITAISGEELLGELHDLIVTTHRTWTSYDDCKNEDYVINTDQGTTSAYMAEFYSQSDYDKQTVNANSGANTPGSLNREHVWPQSVSNGLWNNVSSSSVNGGTDLHHIRPVEYNLNNTRGNYLFGEVSSHNSSTAVYPKLVGGSDSSYIGGYLQGSTFEPVGGNELDGDVNVKGDVARIIFYLYTHYNTYSNVGGTTNGSSYTSSFGTLNFTDIVNASSEDAAIELLLKWNEEDPVSDREKARNEAVATYQGNRNPFIDNVDYADAIWGDSLVELGNPVSMSIDTSNVTLTFEQNSTFSYDGLLVYYVYENGTTRSTNDYTVTPPSLTSLGTKTVIVASNTYNFSLTYEIEVVEEGTISTTPSGYYFEKVSSELSNYEGTYLIVSESYNVAFDGSLTNLDVASNNLSVSISNSQIAYSEELGNATYEITASGSGYDIQSSSGHYIYYSNPSSNGLNTSLSSPSIKNTISINNGDADIVANTTYLRFNSNSDQMRFRYYRSSFYTNQQAIQLYELKGAEDSSPTNNAYDDALAFAQYFNESVGDVYEGENTNSEELMNLWDDVLSSYNELSEDAKAYLNETSDSEDISNMFALYDLVVTSYEVEDFFDRKSTGGDTTPDDEEEGNITDEEGTTTVDDDNDSVPLTAIIVGVVIGSIIVLIVIVSIILISKKRKNS